MTSLSLSLLKMCSNYWLKETHRTSGTSKRGHKYMKLEAILLHTALLYICISSVSSIGNVVDSFPSDKCSFVYKLSTVFVCVFLSDIPPSLSSSTSRDIIHQSFVNCDFTAKRCFFDAPQDTRIPRHEGAQLAPRPDALHGGGVRNPPSAAAALCVGRGDDKLAAGVLGSTGMEELSNAVVIIMLASKFYCF